MKFTVTKGNKSLTWEDGKVSGTMAKAVSRLASLWDGTQIGPHGGPYTKTNHLESPISVATMVRDIYGFDGLEWSGDVPTRGPGYDTEL